MHSNRVKGFKNLASIPNRHTQHTVLCDTQTIAYNAKKGFLCMRQTVDTIEVAC